MQWTWPGFLVVVRDVLSLGLAALGAYLAYLAIRMGREQAETARRQTEIAEVQHRMMLEQSAQRAALVLERSSAMSGIADDDPAINVQEFTLAVVNTGTRAARDSYWTVCVPSWGAYSSTMSALPGSVDVKEDYTFDENTDRFDLLSGRYPGPIYPGQRVECVVLSTRIPRDHYDKAKLVECEYSLQWEDGRYPNIGLAKLDLRMFIHFPPLDSDTA